MLKTQFDVIFYYLFKCSPKLINSGKNVCNPSVNYKEIKYEI